MLVHVALTLYMYIACALSFRGFSFPITGDSPLRAEVEAAQAKRTEDG